MFFPFTKSTTDDVESARFANELSVNSGKLAEAVPWTIAKIPMALLAMFDNLIV